MSHCWPWHVETGLPPGSPSAGVGGRRGRAGWQGESPPGAGGWAGAQRWSGEAALPPGSDLPHRLLLQVFRFPDERELRLLAHLLEVVGPQGQCLRAHTPRLRPQHSCPTSDLSAAAWGQLRPTSDWAEDPPCPGPQQLAARPLSGDCPALLLPLASCGDALSGHLWLRPQLRVTRYTGTGAGRASGPAFRGGGGSLPRLLRVGPRGAEGAGI